MADYVVLKKDDNATGPKAWKVLNRVTGQTADAAGAREAIRLSYDGPGKYGALRSDNAMTAQVDAIPQATADTTPEW